MKSDIQAELYAAHKATVQLKRLTNKERCLLLETIAALLQERKEAIILENEKDLLQMSPEDPRYDRLLLNGERIEALAQSVLDVALLADPTNVSLSKNIREDGLSIEKRTVPLGVVGVIYESRPNVTVDVAALCLRSGNVCVLRGGTDAWHSNRILVNIIREALEVQGLNKDIVQLLPTDRKYVTELLTATKYVDIIIPRGSQSLIEFVRNNAKVPVIETGAGVCHTYVHESADLDAAVRIVANAKISRPSVCNALDTVLVDEKVAREFLKGVAPALAAYKVGVYADAAAYQLLDEAEYPVLHHAQEQDFGREFLSLNCSVKVVSSMEDALAHILKHSSKHSECIVSSDSEIIDIFMNAVDAAAVYSNASTRFTDGGEFGLGAEIGISTQKLHARGPFALEKLVTEKWFVTGQGHIR